MTRREFLQSATVAGAGLAASSAASPEVASSTASAKVGAGAFDVAVVGAGAFGAWTAWHLAKRGARVALLDAYGAGDSRASSGGETRVIRAGYGREEIYSRWSLASLVEWKALSSRHDDALFHRTGVLWMARAEDALSTSTVATLARLGVAHERLERKELERRYPQIEFGPVTWAILEPDSGALMARRAIQAVVREAIASGVSYSIASAAPPSATGRLERLATSAGEIRANAFVFACGPWLPKVFPALLGDRIFPTRQEVFYFGPPAGDDRFAPPKMPIWVDFGAEIYGIPDIEAKGFKIAFDRHGAAIDPDIADRRTTQAILDEVRAFVAGRFPALAKAPLVAAEVCQYENTSNGDFLIDRHPELANVWLVGGGSGHGFKHGPEVGRAVAGLLLDGGLADERFRLSTKAPVQKRTVF